MESIREALIVATDAFEDTKLRSLGAPARDAEELARVLSKPEVGDFEVKVSLNEPDYVVRRRLSEFFRDRGRDDLLLLHVSSHGLKDEDGTLYFATTNTDVDHLEATAIPSDFVNRQMTRSRSARMVLLLDCCFGGAFARGFVHRAGEGVDVAEKFDGRGRVVLTASRAMEWAFEGDQLKGDPRPSIFTSAIVEGLETGKADRDQDSHISVDELYDYVYDHVREITPNQTPSKWTFDVQGDLFLAKSSYRAAVEPAALPLELRAAIESPLANVRAGAVEELARLLRGAHPGLALSARVALEDLVEDDSRRVSDAATVILKLKPGPPAPTPQVPEPARLVGDAGTKESEPAAATVSMPTAQPRRELGEAPAAIWAARLPMTLALFGAALFVVGYLVSGDRGGRWSLWREAREFLNEIDGINVWFVWSPIEAFGVALLVVGAVVAGRVLALAREAADGVLIGVGLVSAAASFGLLGHYFGNRAFYLTLIGALAILAAGALGAVAKKPHEAGDSPPWTLLAAAAGVVLVSLTAFVDVAVELADLGTLGRAYWIGVAVAAFVGATATALAYRLPEARFRTGGILIAVGVQSALHFAALLVQLNQLDKTIRPGGWVGLLGAALLIAAGIGILRGARLAAGSPIAERA